MDPHKNAQFPQRSENPYVGPRPFMQGEDVFGRERETRRLFDQLIADRIVLLHSPSGAGKTSLVQAKLIPVLQEKGWLVFPIARLNQEPPQALREQFPHLNRYTLSIQLSLEGVIEPESQMPFKEVAGFSLDKYLQAYGNRLASKDAGETFRGEVLIVDQFEEILVLDPLDFEAKRAFFGELGDTLQMPERWALFMIREDYLAALEPYVQDIPTRLKSTFPLEPLTRAAAREAIQSAAQQYGVTFSVDAAKMWVDDLSQIIVPKPDGGLYAVAGPHVEPVQLQVATFRLWETLPAGTTEITPEHVRSTGGSGNALAEYFATAVDQVARETGIKEIEIRDWFQEKLISPGRTRTTVLQGVDKSAGLNNVAVERLVNQYLVRQETRGGEVWLELVHDRLIEPVLADNEAWFRSRGRPTQDRLLTWFRDLSRERLLVLLIVETVITIVAVILAIIGWTSR